MSPRGQSTVRGIRSVERASSEQREYEQGEAGEREWPSPVGQGGLELRHG